MRKIRSVDTGPERQFRKSLWARGIRYRKNVKRLPGNPDICIPRQRIAIFVDGEFWHGFDWQNKKPRMKANSDYWIPKIERTIERDRENTRCLEDAGWTVVRFWERDIKHKPTECLERVLALLRTEGTGHEKA